MFVYAGADTYESYNAAKTNLARISKEKNFEVKIIDEDDIHSINDFLYLTDTIDMFGSTPVIFAKRVLNNKDIAAYISDNIETLQHLDIIIWQDKGIDGKTKIAKTLAFYKLIKSFDAPKPVEIKVWIKERIREVDISLSEDSINFIVEHVSTDKWMIENELQKLSVLDIKKASIEDIKSIFGLTVKGDIWKFMDYVGNRQKSKAIAEFEKLNMYEDTTQLMITLLQREFRLIAQILSAKGSNSKLSGLGITPFIVKKSESKARNFTFNEIREYVGRLFNLDYAIKSGKIEDKIGLTLFLLTL